MRLSLLFILPLLFTTWQTTFAATVDDCSKINTSGERLACFDAISKQNELPASEEIKGDEQKSKWVLETIQPEMNAGTMYTIIMIADHHIGRNHRHVGAGAILISCWKSSMSVFFLTGGPLDEHNGRSFVRYQLDQEPTKTIEMSLQETQLSIGLWSSEQSIPFIKEMFGHDKMLVLLEGYKGNTETLEFPIKGLEEALKPLRKACNW